MRHVPQELPRRLGTEDGKSGVSPPAAITHPHMQLLQPQHAPAASAPMPSRHPAAEAGAAGMFVTMRLEGEEAGTEQKGGGKGSSVRHWARARTATPTYGRFVIHLTARQLLLQRPVMDKCSTNASGRASQAEDSAACPARAKQAAAAAAGLRAPESVKPPMM